MRGGTFQEQVATEGRQVMSVREVGVVGRGADRGAGGSQGLSGCSSPADQLEDPVAHY